MKERAEKMTKNEKTIEMQKIRKLLKRSTFDKQDESDKIKELRHIYGALSVNNQTHTTHNDVIQVFRNNGFIVRPDANGWTITLR